MTEPNGSIRSARAIIVHGGSLALIERRRNGRHFFIFPGGTLEPGETPEQALVREVDEETGLIVVPDRLVAEVAFPDRLQTFWLATIIGGEFGSGVGAEMTGSVPADRGTYLAVWMPLAMLPRTPILPSCLASEVFDRSSTGWPPMPLVFHDPDMWWA